MSRPVCYRCHKPQVTCICSGLAKVKNHTSVLVLQHPRERLHPIGTARFAELGLANARVEVAWDAAAREPEPPSWLPPGAALLYPADGARDLRELPAAERPHHLVVLDGTWNTVRTLYRDKQWLHALPHYRFLPAAPGRYRLRREPQLDYVSTIEAIVEALRILEPQTAGLDGLLAAFDAMIDRQISYVGSGIGVARTRSKRRPEAELKLPRALVEGFDRLLVVHGESSRPPRGQPPEFVYFTALALGSELAFERVMLPSTGMPDADHMAHMGLCRADFERALSAAEFALEWRAFLRSCGPKPLLAAWNQRTLDLLTRTIGGPASRMALKAAYRSRYGTDARGLEETVQQHGLVLAPNALRGRSASRLAGAVAVAQFLHAPTRLGESGLVSASPV